MDKHLRYAFYFLIVFGIAAIGLLYFYSNGVAVLNPKGMIGAKERDLLLLCTWTMLLVVIPVFLMTFFIAWKYRESNKNAEYKPDWAHNTLAEIIWWGFPLIIIVVLSVLTWNSCHELDPFKPIESNKKALRIQAVALQWKWLFIYPDQRIATVNYMQIPIDRPIDFEITADAPMNSFWIPELGGQVYAMAGMRSKLHLIADQRGSFRGCSSNISGKGFAGMSFMTHAGTEEEFEQWVSSSTGSMSLSYDEYDELVKPSEYVPPATYSLGESGLFDWIIMKYMKPMPETKRMAHDSVH